MKESKFINKATSEYLKSKSGSTFQQQITELKTLVHEDYGSNFKRFNTLDKKLDGSGQAILHLQSEMASMNDIAGNLQWENFQLKRQIKNITIGFTIALLGVALCLAKLLT